MEINVSGQAPSPKELVIRRNPNPAYWLDGRIIGNLILTNKRFVFLQRITMTPREKEDSEKLGKETTTEELIDFALRLRKQNFQIPLSSIVSVESKLYTYLPPTLIMRVTYQSRLEKKIANFRLKSPLKSVLRLYSPTVVWVRALREAVKQAKGG